MSAYQVSTQNQWDPTEPYFHIEVTPLDLDQLPGSPQAIFIDVVDAMEIRLDGAQLYLQVNEQSSMTVTVDKPSTEQYGADVPMYPDSVYTLTPANFQGDSISHIPAGQAIEIRWVADQMMQPEQPQTENGLFVSVDQLEAVLADLKGFAGQLDAMQSQLDQAIDSLTAIKRDLTDE